MLNKMAKLLAIGAVVLVYYWFFERVEPSFSTEAEEALLVYLNGNCTKAELGLEEGTKDWKLVKAWPNKKPPALEKEPVYTRKVHLKGWYLPEGKTGKINYLKFKAK
ncbi:MAG: hypothetical protein RBS43_11110 [Candidatus Cloacimonas sp.]|jgi:hypothetical protein|nr:hypothetical protein [Candidatus Cloacimonas sp.]